MMSNATLIWAEEALSTLKESAAVTGLSFQSIHNWRKGKMATPLSREQHLRLEALVIEKFLKLARIIQPHVPVAPEEKP
jgi:hypothetical protein